MSRSPMTVDDRGRRAAPTDRHARLAARRRRWITTAGAGAALVLALAACGSDDASPSTSVPTTLVPTAVTPTAAPSSATSRSAAAFDPAGYCAAELTLETAANGLDPSGDPKGFADQLLALVEPAAALAPPELQATFASAIATLRSVSTSGDPALLDGLETPPAVHAFDLKTCGWQRVDVTAADYMFEGLPASLKAGPNDFELTNTGKEFHVLVIVKKKAGVTESFDELLSDPDAESKTETVLGVAASPGAPAGSGVVDLQPGEYLVLCPIPVGSVDGATEASGPPHFTLGMHQTLTVT